jgi:ribosomal protein L18
MNKTNIKTLKRERRHKRIRARVSGTTERPRLAVFKSNKFMYAQLIDDTAGKHFAQQVILKVVRELKQNEQLPSEQILQEKQKDSKLLVLSLIEVDSDSLVV